MSGVRLCGGPGVGTVTRAGLGLEIGGPAINPVPRQMILEAVTAAAEPELCARGLEVEISVPRGEELAKRTLNARLGIERNGSVERVGGVERDEDLVVVVFRVA